MGGQPPIESLPESMEEASTHPVALPTPPAPSLPTTSQPITHTDTLGFQEQLQEISPQSLAEGVHDQLLGEKTQQQEQAEQQRETQLQQLSAQEQQSYQQYLATKKAEQQQLVQQVTQAKIQARQTQAEFSGSSAVMQTLNRQGDLSELALVEKGTRDAVTRQQREANFKNMLSAPKGQQKGPQAEGEGGGGKGSMVDRMVSGGEQPKFDQQKADALQRQSEKTVGE